MVDVRNCKYFKMEVNEGEKNCCSPEEYNNCEENPNCRFKVFAKNRDYINRFRKIYNIMDNFILTFAGVPSKKLLETPNSELSQEGIMLKELMMLCEVEVIDG